MRNTKGTARGEHGPFLPHHSDVAMLQETDYHVIDGGEIK